MHNTSESLRSLGWSADFAAALPELDFGQVARVASVDRGRVWLLDTSGLFPAVLGGSFRRAYPFQEDHPCVGDWVVAERVPGGEARVRDRLPRRSWLRRKTPGLVMEHQMIAANVDVVFVVQSCHFDFNPRRLDRYLVMVAEGGAEAVLLLTKTDLVDAQTLAGQQQTLAEAGIRVPCHAVSNLNGQGLEQVRNLLRPAATHGFVGSSGVGKSTLINHLLGSATLATGGTSATGEGRHTTTRRELVRLESGAWVIDSPGMREFGLLGGEDGLAERFASVAEAARQCRFRDCRHQDEPGCAVRAAVEAGDLPAEVLAHYLDLRQEAGNAQAARDERRRQQRAFGKRIYAMNKALGRR